MNDGLSAAVRANLITLQRLSSDLGRTQNRLATHKRADTPSDDPPAYFTASALSARAAALNTALDGTSLGKQVLETPNAGIESIQSPIKNMRSIAYDALSSPSTLAEVTGNVTGLTGATAVTLDNGDTIMVSDGTTTAIYSRSDGQDVQDLIDAVNATANLNVEARFTADGRIQLQAAGGNNVTIGGSASVGELGALGLAAGTTISTSNSLLTAGAERAVAADMDTEGAMLLALRTRRDLAATSLSLAAEADKPALRLFGVGSG